VNISHATLPDFANSEFLFFKSCKAGKAFSHDKVLGVDVPIGKYAASFAGLMTE
jgi:hypothetical protein